MIYVNLGELCKREQNKCLRKEGQHKKRRGRNTQHVLPAVRRSVMWKVLEMLRVTDAI